MICVIEQRTALVNQLQQALVEYYPAALEAFEDWTQPFCWDFVIQFPTPEKLTLAGRRRWEKFLHTQKLWRSQTADKRLEIFQNARAFCGSAAVTGPKVCWRPVWPSCSTPCNFNWTNIASKSK